MTQITLTKEYVLVETDDIDFTMLRQAAFNQQAEELQVETISTQTA